MSRSRSKSKTPRVRSLNPNEIETIASFANANTLFALSQIDKGTSKTTKLQYDRKMPKLNMSKHTKQSLTNDIWNILSIFFIKLLLLMACLSILSIIYNDDMDQWPESIWEYFYAIRAVPSFETNRKPYNDMYFFNTKRGYLEFMKRISKTTIFGFYCWLNGRFIDYYVKEGWDGTNQKIKNMTNILKRPPSQAVTR